MTTKFLDYKNCTFNILLSWRCPKKKAFSDELPLCPQPPSSKAKILFYCRLAVSETRRTDTVLSNWQAIVALNLLVLQQGMGCHICVTVRLLVCQGGETMYWQATAHVRLSVNTVFFWNLPDDYLVSLLLLSVLFLPLP